MAFKEALGELLRETFEGMVGNGTYFSDSEPNSGLFGTINSVSAEQASTKVSGKSTLAGHVIHTAYYLRVVMAEFKKEDLKVDWEGSWTEQVVSEQRWQEVKQELHSQYEQLRSHYMDGPEISSEEEFIGAMAVLAHSAFHLGAIRQLVGKKLAESTCIR